MKIIYGYPGDILGSVWHYWWSEYYNTKLHSPNPLSNYLVQTLTKLSDNVTATLIVQLLGFALAATTAYYLVTKLTRRRTAGIIGGLTYGFSLYNLWQGMQHPEILLGISWLPLYVLTLLNFEKARFSHRSRTATVLAAATFALVFTTSVSVGYFAILFTLGFFLLNLLKRFSTALQRTVESPNHPSGNRYQTAKQSMLRFLIRYSLLAVLCFVFTLPATHPMLRYYLNPQDSSPQIQNIRQTMELRQFDEVIAYGARPWDYLVPSIFHPVFGEHVENFYTHLEENFTFQFWSPSLPERVNFIPLTILALAGYAIWKVFKNQKSEIIKITERKNILIFSVLALWMFWISLPAQITIRGIPFYSPSYFLFRLFPMFRVYARAGIFVLLCVTVLATYGLKFLLEAIANSQLPNIIKKYLVTYGWLLIVAFIFFENLNFPPFHLLNLSKIPEVYTWLAEQPGELTIIDYPRDMEPGGGCTPNVDPWIRKDFCPTCSLYFQTVHHQALFTGDSLEPEDRQTIADLSSEETYRILFKNGVNLVIVHTQDPFPQKNPLDSCQSRRIMEKPKKIAPGFKLIKEFDGAAVYEVLP